MTSTLPVKEWYVLSLFAPRVFHLLPTLFPLSLSPHLTPNPPSLSLSLSLLPFTPSPFYFYFPPNSSSEKEKKEENTECTEPKIVHWTDAPDDIRDNEFIHSGYRVNYDCWSAAKSICELHNETMNVWTHLLGCVFVGILLFVTSATVSPYGHDRILTEYDIPYSNLSLSSDDMNILGLSHTPHVWTNPVKHPKCFPSSVLQDLEHSTETPNPNHPKYHDIFEQMDFNPRHLEATLGGMYMFMKQRVPQLEGIVDGIRSRGSELQSEIETAYKDSLEKIRENVDHLKEVLENACVGCSGSIQQVEQLREEIVHNFEVFRSSLQEHGHHMAEGYKLGIDNFRKSMKQLSHGISSVNDLKRVLHLHDIHYYMEQWPLLVFMFSAMFCLLCSSIFHLFAAVNHVSLTLQKLDYAGICILIGGSTVPIIFYGFYCDDTLRLTYLYFTAFIAVIGFYVSLSEYFSTPELRSVRAGVFILMGAAGAIPMSHMFYISEEPMDLAFYVLLMGALYIFGAMLYAFRMPECCMPGKFDTFGSSHQLFHIFVFLAVCTHYIGVMDFYEWRIRAPCPN